MKSRAKTISIQAEISILKPVRKVFESVLEPAPYFIKKADGPMKEGAEVYWEFPEFEGAFPIRVKKIVRDRLIRFEWPRGAGTEMNRVEFTFQPFKKNITTVYVTEAGWPDTSKWWEASYKNCMGWTHMITSLKAWLEHGVNLREGAFVHMKFQ